MVALEILIVLLLGYIVIFNKVVKVEFKVKVEYVTPTNDQPTPLHITNPDPYAEPTEEEKKYYEDSVNLITAINRVLAGEDITPVKEDKK
jgi:hypothetical protein